MPPFALSAFRFPLSAFRSPLVRALVVTAFCFLLAWVTRAEARDEGIPQLQGLSNAVLDWADIVQPAINNAAAPRPPASSEVLHATIQLAVYDAVMAIEGGYKPFAGPIAAPPGADVRAAVATAAYRTALARVANSQVGYLDQQYANYLLRIPDGAAKTDGIQVGEAAASAILALRANDGFNNTVLYDCSANPPPVPEFEPNGGCGTQPVDVKVGQIVPFTLTSPSQFRPAGPPALTSLTYLLNYYETKELGRQTSVLRTAEQTDIAHFWSEHTYVHWNRNLIRLAICHGLNVRDTARLFAMVHTAAADAVIAGWEAKYFYRFWRPRTAIPRANTDGNVWTASESGWTPLLTVNHPEYPSGHSFFSAALLGAVASFFETDRVSWTLTTNKQAVPLVVKEHRTYSSLSAIMREVINARIWSGLHWRQSMNDGVVLGQQVVNHVTANFFRPE